MGGEAAHRGQAHPTLSAGCVAIPEDVWKEGGAQVHQTGPFPLSSKSGVSIANPIDALRQLGSLSGQIARWRASPREKDSIRHVGPFARMGEPVCRLRRQFAGY